MINEKMLEYLILGQILYTPDGNLTDDFKDLEEEASDTLENMITRYFKLQDEFIKQYELPNPLVKIP